MTGQPSCAGKSRVQLLRPILSDSSESFLLFFWVNSGTRKGPGRPNTGVKDRDQKCSAHVDTARVCRTLVAAASETRIYLVHFSLSTRWVVVGPERRFGRDPLPVFSVETFVSSSDMGRDVRVVFIYLYFLFFLYLSVHHFLCRSHCRPPCRVHALKDGLDKLPCCVPCPNHNRVSVC